MPAGQGAKTKHPLSGGGAGTVPGGQGALLAVPMPATIQRKTRAENKNRRAENPLRRGANFRPGGKHSINQRFRTGSHRDYRRVVRSLASFIAWWSRTKRSLRQSKSAVQQH